MKHHREKNLTRYGLVTLGATVGVALICARFGWLPGLMISALLCLAVAFLMSALAPSDKKAVESELTARAKRFQTLGHRIRGGETASRLAGIGERIHELVQHIRRDPQHLEQVHELVHHHLPKAQALVEEYVRLVDQPNLEPRYAEDLAEMESTVRLLDRALETQNRRFLARDVDTFSVDRRGFEEVLRLDYSLDGTGFDSGESGLGNSR